MTDCGCTLPFTIFAYVSSGIIGDPISASNAASILPFAAYCRPASFTSSSFGSVTAAASGALNRGAFRHGQNGVIVGKQQLKLVNSRLKVLFAVGESTPADHKIFEVRVRSSESEHPESSASGRFIISHRSQSSPDWHYSSANRAIPVLRSHR